MLSSLPLALTGNLTAQIAMSTVAVACLVVFCIALARWGRTQARQWAILAIVCVVLGIGLIATSVGIGMSHLIQRNRTERAAVALPADGTLTPPDGSITLKVPPEWIKMPKLDPASIVAAGAEDRSITLMVRKIPKAAFDEHLRQLPPQLRAADPSLEDLERQFLPGFTASLQDVHAEPSRMAPIGPYPSVRLRFVASFPEQPEKPVAFHVAIVETKDAFYYLIPSCEVGVEEQNKPVIEAIFSSFSAKAGPP